MEIYIISDSHFYHNNIIKYGGRTIFMTKKDLKLYNKLKNASEERQKRFHISNETSKRMNKGMIRRWNSVVQGDDLVIHLGDVVLSNKTKYFAELIKQLNGRKILVRGNHDRKSIHWYLTHGFDFVCDNFSIGHIIFTHRPIPKGEFLAMPKYKLNIHGHNHQRKELDVRIYKNISVERTNYFPVKLDKILGEYKLKLKRKIKQGD